MERFVGKGSGADGVAILHEMFMYSPNIMEMDEGMNQERKERCGMKMNESMVNAVIDATCVGYARKTDGDTTTMSERTEAGKTQYYQKQFEGGTL